MICRLHFAPLPCKVDPPLDIVPVDLRHQPLFTGQCSKDKREEGCRSRLDVAFVQHCFQEMLSISAAWGGWNKGVEGGGEKIDLKYFELRK